MKRYGKIVVGVGGNIGSGKTTVAKIFQSYGMHYISADKIGWSVLPEIAPELRNTFGKEIFCGSNIDREKLRDVVFADSSSLKTLNKLSHPKILRKIYQKLNGVRRDMVVIDAALLFDWPGLLKRIDIPILVKSPKNLKRKRARQRGIPAKIVDQILQKQKEEAVMAKKAKYVINNNGTFAELKEQCRKIFKELKNDC